MRSLGRAIADAKLVVSIAAGLNAPVRLGWEPRAWVAVTGTREARPGRAEARIVVATINASDAPLTVAPFVARIRLLAPGTGAPLCDDQLVWLDTDRPIPPGRAHQAWVTLGCRAMTEGIHAVEVDISPPGAERIPVARYALRIRTGPLLPLPQ